MTTVRTEDHLISSQTGTIHGMRVKEDGGEIAVRVNGKVVRFEVEGGWNLIVGDPVVVRLYTSRAVTWGDVVAVPV